MDLKKFLRGLLFGPYAFLGLAIGFLLWWGLNGFSPEPGAAWEAMLQGAVRGQAGGLIGLLFCAAGGVLGGLYFYGLTADLAGWEVSRQGSE